MNRIDRISALLVQLQSRSVLRAADAARRFEVSVRTIYRDIRTLEEAGVPICGDAGVGYSLVEGYRLPPLMFTPQEALAFLTAEKLIEKLTDSHNSRHFQQGMDKIRAVMHGVPLGDLETLGESISVRRSPYTPMAKVPDLHQTILRSISERRILRIHYTNADRSATEREVEAVGVAFMHPNWYLLGWCHLRSTYRTFRLDRIDRLEATERPFTIADHPPLRELLGYENEQLNEIKPMKINSIEVKNLESINTIALSHTGDYSGIGAAFGAMSEWATRNNYWVKGPRMIGIYHDDPTSTEPTRLRSSACLEDMGGMEPGAGMTRYEVSGGKYLVLNAELKMAEYGAAWQKIYEELRERGLTEHDYRDHYELYVSCVDSTQGNDAPWIVELCVPVK